MGQMENISFEAKKPEQIDPDMLLLARNFVQLYHAEHEIHIGHVSETEDGGKENALLAQETERRGREFSDWLETPAGSKALKEYVQAHPSEDEIGRFAGMDDLVAKYKEYHSGTVH